MGGVGSGKTYTSIFWAASQYGVDFFTEERPLIVITTAMKRDLIEKGAEKPDWQQSLENCGIHNYIVDSWQNIEKYYNISNSVFIFDEQRVVGYGKWGKCFIKTAWNDNKWILLSATPGDVWMDYMPVFIANKFYRNRLSSPLVMLYGIHMLNSLRLRSISARRFLRNTGTKS